MFFFLFYWLHHQLAALGVVEATMVVDLSTSEEGWVQSTALYSYEGQPYLDGSFIVYEEKDRVMNTYVAKGLYGWHVKLPLLIDKLPVRTEHVEYPCEIYML